MNPGDRKFVVSEWFKLFLVLAFPIHLWIILAGFQDLGYIIRLSSIAGGIGFMSYLLLYALVDSTILAILVVTINLFTPKYWPHQYRFIWLSLIGYSITAASVTEKETLFNIFISSRVIQSLSWLSYEVFSVALLAILFGLVNWLFPKWVIQPNNQFQMRLYSIAGKLATLSIFYILIDIVAIINIIGRNVSPS